MKQTILGASGSIGKLVAKELINYTSNIRLVSRNPVAINPSDELMPADLTKADEIDRGVKGSAIVYVTIGFDYSLKNWREKWPAFIKNTIDACEKHKAKLVFFDNMYSYDTDCLANMTEDCAINPSSEKGKVRADVVHQIITAWKQGRVQALIARAPDFIGPSNSFFIETCAKPIKKGSTANWLYDATKQHNFIIVDDAARAVALLGNKEEAYNQTWHLPSTPAMTGAEWIKLAADSLAVQSKLRTVPRWMLRMMGLFNPVMKELDDVRHQLTNDYFFNSEKIEKAYGLKHSDIAGAIGRYTKV